jgi:hypothetical protein
MRPFLRPVAVALSVSCLAAAMATLSAGAAFAQAKAAPQAPAQGAPSPDAPQVAVKQIALTDKQVDGVLTASKQMDDVTAQQPENAKPDPKVLAQLEDIAKKSGFASYEEYTNVTDNISMVLAGFDPTTKKYVGPEAVIKMQIAQVNADKKMPAKDKKEALADLNEALKAPAPAIENKGNIDIVTKYYDKLVAVMGDDQE